MFYIGGRGFVCQIIEPVMFARSAFIFALRNIALGEYLDTYGLKYIIIIIAQYGSIYCVIIGIAMVYQH